MIRLCSLLFAVLFILGCDVVNVKPEEVVQDQAVQDPINTDSSNNNSRWTSIGNCITKVYEEQWSSGWSIARTFGVGSKEFLFLLKTSIGTVHIQHMDDLVKERVDTRELVRGITEAEFYRLDGITYLILYRNWDGRVWIYKMNSNGSIGDLVETHRWSSGWDTFRPYSVEGKDFIMLIKSGTGDVHIHKLNSNGTIGNRTYDVRWSSGWTDAQKITFAFVGDPGYLLLRKEGTGLFHLRKMEKDGTLGDLLCSRDWSSGWTDVMFFESVSNKYSYMLLYKNATGQVHINRIYDNGYIEIYPYATGRWSSGWTDMQTFGYRPTKRAFFIKEKTGEVDINKIEVMKIK